MRWGSRWGMQWGWPGGLLPQEVDVRIVRGLFVPCRACHWYSVCVVPKRKFLAGFKEFTGDSSIIFHSEPGARVPQQIYYHCQDYTVLVKKKK